MKTIKVSFEVSVERTPNDVTEEHFKKDMSRMLHVYGRSNGLCVENVGFETQLNGFEYVSFSCRGFGCVLSNSCLRHRKWRTLGDHNYIDHCDTNTRDCYLQETPTKGGKP